MNFQLDPFIKKNNSAFAPIFCPAVKFLFLVKIFQFLHIFIDLFITFSTVFFIFYVITVKKLYSKKSIEFWPFLVIFYIKNWIFWATQFFLILYILIAHKILFFTIFFNLWIFSLTVFFSVKTMRFLIEFLIL